MTQAPVWVTKHQWSNQKTGIGCNKCFKSNGFKQPSGKSEENPTVVPKFKTRSKHPNKQCQRQGPSDKREDSK